MFSVDYLATNLVYVSILVVFACGVVVIFTAGENRIPGGGVFMIPQMGTGGEPRQRV